MNNVLENFQEKIRYFILILLVILFPVNQQLHIRPFPSIDGVIIDYLMLKISIPELLIVFLTIFNIRWVSKFFKENILIIKRFSILLFLLVFFMALNIYRSRYPILGIYENLILILIFINAFTISYFQKLNTSFLLTNSIKFWMTILLILGSFQFYFQQSVLGSYYYFGEFNYSSDNYHIKQDGMLLKNLIPAYGIFSHSNIYGAFFLICGMFLHIMRKNNIYFTLITIFGVLLSGSMNILIGLILFFVFFYLKLNYKILLIYIFSIYVLLFYLSGGYKAYEEDLSVYRRLYMVNLSNLKFSENLPETLFGFGYYNYFNLVSEDLYFYEIIRFFQPPHNIFYLVVWNYGLIFLIAFLILCFSLIKNADYSFKIFFLVLISISVFDHFLFTNHQLKMLLFFVIPYSLNRVFSIKIN